MSSIDNLKDQLGKLQKKLKMYQFERSSSIYQMTKAQIREMERRIEKAEKDAKK